MDTTLDCTAFRLLKEGIVIPAIPLALDKHLCLDERRQKALVRYYLEAGSGGIAAAVHTTQFEIRNHQETFVALLELVLRQITAYEREYKKRIVRIAGICGRTEQARREARLVRSLGYDIGLLAPSAFVQDADTDDLVAHYYAVADEMPVFGFYLQPSVGGRVLPYRFWRKVLAHPNVVGIKIACFNRYGTLEVLRAVADSQRAEELTLYTGNDDNIVLDLLTPFHFETQQGPIVLRFDGGLLGQWCVWTKKAVKLLEEVKKIRNQPAIPMELLSRAQRITDVNAAVFDASNGFAGCIAGLHEVLRRQGFFDEIICYEPHGRLSPGQMEEIDRVYASSADLHDDAFVSSHLQRWLQTETR